MQAAVRTVPFRFTLCMRDRMRSRVAIEFAVKTRSERLNTDTVRVGAWDCVVATMDR